MYVITKRGVQFASALALALDLNWKAKVSASDKASAQRVLKTVLTMHCHSGTL